MTTYNNDKYTMLQHDAFLDLLHCKTSSTSWQNAYNYLEAGILSALLAMESCRTLVSTGECVQQATNSFCTHTEAPYSITNSSLRYKAPFSVLPRRLCADFLTGMRRACQSSTARPSDLQLPFAAPRSPCALPAPHISFARNAILPNACCTSHIRMMLRAVPEGEREADVVEGQPSCCKST